MSKKPKVIKSYNKLEINEITSQKIKLTSLRVRELNYKQKEFLELANDKQTKVVFVHGPAGTSKSFLAVFQSLKMLNEGQINDIIYVRSVVESSDSKMGFLKGQINEKLAPYLEPLLDKLREFLSKDDIEILMKSGHLIGISTGFLRGLNWRSKVIVADESQNMNFKELFTLITRVGEYSKIFLLGDPSQSDINGKSGFEKMISIFYDEESRQNGIHVFGFTEEDIVRSGLVKFITQKVKNTY